MDTAVKRCLCGRCRKCRHRAYVAYQRRWIGFTLDKICDALRIVLSPQSSLDPRKIQHLRLPDYYFMTRDDNKRLRDPDESRRWFKCPFGQSGLLR